MRPHRHPSRCRLEGHDESGGAIYRHGAPTLVEAHMDPARPIIAVTPITNADCNGSLRGRSRGLLCAAMAAVAAVGTGVLIFVPAVVAQPASALGELSVGKAALGDWRTDASLNDTTITE